jgi:hypothetical protein
MGGLRNIDQTYVTKGFGDCVIFWTSETNTSPETICPGG